MSLRLKRNETLREGLQRVAEQRLREAPQIMGQEPELVHEARKAIKSLQATLRLTRGALDAETRHRWHDG